MDEHSDVSPSPRARDGGDQADDAFGAILRDYHEYDEGFVVVERDDGWIGTSAGPEGYFATYDDWSLIEREAMDWVDGRTLDVGCGAGRHALYLQERGHAVTGIDLSSGAIEVARDRGVEDVRRVDVADVAESFDPGTFDTVLMLGNNFGLVGTADRAPAILDGLATVTSEDGTIVASAMDPLDTDDEAHLAYHELNRERGRLPGAVRIRVWYKTFCGGWFDYLHVGQETMREVLAETAWTIDELVAGDGGRYAVMLVKE